MFSNTEIHSQWQLFPVIDFTLDFSAPWGATCITIAHDHWLGSFSFFKMRFWLFPSKLTWRMFFASVGLICSVFCFTSITYSKSTSSLLLIHNTLSHSSYFLYEQNSFAVPNHSSNKCQRCTVKTSPVTYTCNRIILFVQRQRLNWFQRYLTAVAAMLFMLRPDLLSSCTVTWTALRTLSQRFGFTTRIQAIPVHQLYCTTDIAYIHRGQLVALRWTTIKRSLTVC